MLVTNEAEAKDDSLQPKTIAILATIGLHLFAALLFGIWQVVPKIEKKPEITASVVADPEAKKKKFQKQNVKKQADQVVAQAAPPMTKLLTSNSIAMMAVPKMAALDGPIGLGEGNLGVGMGSSAQMGRGARFFGQNVAGNMGVVFDVSGSMHEFLPVVVGEIKRVFRNAMVVCANSADMSSTYTDGDPEAVPYEDATYENARPISTSNEDASNAHFELLSLPNCWFIHRDYNSIGEGIEFLMNEQVTTIFVFSDFQDTIDREYVGGLKARAKEEKYRLTLHVLEEVRDKNGEPSLQALARETKGLYAVGELLKRVRR